MPAVGEVCAQCAKTIDGGKTVSALDRHWHRACFVCCRCACALSPDFKHKDGAVFCDKCIALGAPPCRRCGAALVDGVTLEAMGHRYHQRCFTCKSCGDALGTSFVKKDIDNEADVICNACDDKWQGHAPPKPKDVGEPVAPNAPRADKQSGVDSTSLFAGTEQSETVDSAAREKARLAKIEK